MQTVEQWMNTMKSMLEVCQGKSGKGQVLLFCLIPADHLAGLPKSLQQALLNLSTQQEITSVQIALAQLITETPLEEDAETYQFAGEELIPEEWCEGTEEFSKMTEAELWQFLGLELKCAIPALNPLIDPNGKVTPRDPEGPAFFADEANTSRLQPRWHQLVGICKLMCNAFEKKPVLLMDEVGLGKTLEAAGFVAVTAYYRDYFREQGFFPGHFSKFCPPIRDAATHYHTESKRWPGSTDGNIPDESSIFVVPVTLRGQMVHELYRYLEPGGFDILPYEGTHPKRKDFWVEAWSKSEQPPGRKILIATTSVSFFLLLLPNHLRRIQGCLFRCRPHLFHEQPQAQSGSRTS